MRIFQKLFVVRPLDFYRLSGSLGNEQISKDPSMGDNVPYSGKCERRELLDAMLPESEAQFRFPPITGTNTHPYRPEPRLG